MQRYSVKHLGNFMRKLLMEDTFDSFLLAEGVLRTSVTLHVDGALLKDFYTEEEWAAFDAHHYEYAPWDKLRDLFYSQIRGNKTPLEIHLTMMLKPEYAEKIIPDDLRENVTALLLNVRFSEGKAQLITGVNYRTFTLDKSAETAWDRTISRFLESKEIETES